MAGPVAVLVVEDDAAIAKAVLYAFERDGMLASWADTLASARPQLGACDVVVLDLGLPDGSGFSLLNLASRLNVVPRLLVLTSRDEDVDCVAALEAGADDYVTKPFSPRALIARVRATLRRGRCAAAETETECLSHTKPGLRVDEARREVCLGGQRLALTKTEFDVLQVLAHAPGRVFTRDQLVERVWGGAYALTPRTVDSHVKALRRKLELAGAPGIIETVRAVGFRLLEPS
jgi:DNA-binding response OmpR family regulator